MKTVRNLLVLLIIALILYFLLRPHDQGPTKAVTKALPEVSKPVAPKPMDGRHRLVDDLLSKHRAAIGVCLQKSTRAKTSRVELIMGFRPVGTLESVRLTPDLGEPTRECLATLIRSWKIPAAPDLSPLAVSKRIELESR